MDHNAKKKTTANRQWRFTEKPTTAPGLQSYKSVSPKYAVGYNPSQSDNTTNTATAQK
jgi:hypothetical protein